MDTRNFTYMFYGLAIAWGAVLAYVVLLTAREGRLRREMERLRQMIQDREVRR
jgi:CcmD family protein